MSAFDAYTRLQGEIDGRITCDEPLARHTTWRVGGPAALYIEVDALSDLRQVVAALRECRVEYVVLGKGSNILASDSGYQGAVIVLGKGFRKHAVVDAQHLVAGAGCVLAALVRETFNQGLSGLEFAVGIPGTLGGALAMNAGTKDSWIGEIVESVTLLTPAGELKKVSGSEISWGYRRSNLPSMGIILESSLKVSQGIVFEVRGRMEAGLKRRKATQPLSLPNAGSVFMNPEGDHAARLIESSGLKGARSGGAQVSEMHANFIVNTGGATAEDIVDLMARIRSCVKEIHGVELRPEVRFLGSFES